MSVRIARRSGTRNEARPRPARRYGSGMLRSVHSMGMRSTDPSGSCSSAHSTPSQVPRLSSGSRWPRKGWNGWVTRTPESEGLSAVCWDREQPLRTDPANDRTGPEELEVRGFGIIGCECGDPLHVGGHLSSPGNRPVRVPARRAAEDARVGSQADRRTTHRSPPRRLGTSPSSSHRRNNGRRLNRAAVVAPKPQGLHRVCTLYQLPMVLWPLLP